jgi:hypothetical protein
MSSPKAAASKAAHKATQKPKAARSRAAAHPKPIEGPADDAALQLAADIEASLADGRLDLLAPQTLQALLGAACKAYAAQIEAGQTMAALSQRTTVTPTEVMITASGLLRAANLAVFELGMWQSWTGR